MHWKDKRLGSGFTIVPILDGNSDNVAHAGRKICLFRDCSRSNQMAPRDQITEIAPFVRTFFFVTILYISTIGFTLVAT